VKVKKIDILFQEFGFLNEIDFFKLTTFFSTTSSENIINLNPLVLEFLFYLIESEIFCAEIDKI